MTFDNILQAIEEANRFITRANAAMERLKEDAYASYGSPETAACRRASMDLTRALAKMRNNS
jgi:hypothetical protein